MDYTNLINSLNDIEAPPINTEKSSIIEGKDITDIDEILLERYCFPIGMLFVSFLNPFGFIIDICIPFKRVLIIDSKNKRIILCNKNIYGCKRDQIIYDYSQISKIRLYVTSTPDPKRPFDKLYFINSDIYSKNDQKDTLFENISYDEVKYGNYVKLFEKHLNIEVEPFEVFKC